MRGKETEMYPLYNIIVKLEGFANFATCSCWQNFLFCVDDYINNMVTTTTLGKINYVKCFSNIKIVVWLYTKETKTHVM